MNTWPTHDADLEARLRIYYRQRRAAPPESDALWARLVPRLDGRAFTPSHTHYLRGAASAGPLPAPTAPIQSHRRFLVGFPTVAAALVIVLLAATLFGVFTLAHRGTSSPPSILDRSKIALLSISMVSASEGWAVGTTNGTDVKGVILHYHQGRWWQVSNPYDTGELRSVDMLSATDGWIVGDKGTILRYQSDRWVKVKSPVSTALGSVSMLSPEEGWAMGQDILHYHNGVWSLVSGPQHGFIFSVEDSSLSGGWAVGGGGTVLQYTAGQWQAMSAPKIDLNSVAMIASNVGWAVGSGGCSGNLLHYQDGTWSVVENPAPQETLWSIAMASPDEGWAVGNTHSDTGLILHYSQGQWTEVPSPTKEFLLGVTLISPAEGWAVGSHGAILHYLNGVWSVYTTAIPLESTQPPAAGVDLTPYGLSSISMVSPDEGWAVGNTSPYYMIDASGTPISGNTAGVQPIILHYLHGRWTPQPLPDFQHSTLCTTLAGPGACANIALSSISMVSAQEGWAVGSTVLPVNLIDTTPLGILLHYVGGRWTLVNLHVSSLGSLYMRSANDGWMIGHALGPDGDGPSEVWHYDGQSWGPISDPLVSRFFPYHIIGTANGELWVSAIDFSVPVGDGEDGNSPTVLLHYDGTRWSKVDPQIANGGLYGFAFVSPEEGWAVGTLLNTDQHRPSEADGLIPHYHNGVWEEQTHFKGPFSQTYFSLTSGAMVSASEGWAVGSQGTILHYQNGSWSLYQGS